MDYDAFCYRLFPLINEMLPAMYHAAGSLEWTDLEPVIRKQLDIRRAVKAGARSSDSFRSRLTPRGAALYDELHCLRSEIARRQACPPYIIFSNRTLYEMAVRQPFTIPELTALHGVGEKNSKRHGKAFLAVVTGFTGGNRFPAEAELPERLEEIPSPEEYPPGPDVPPAGVTAAV